MPKICNKDCFNCPYPDCINDEFSADDAAELDIIERDFVDPPKKRQSAKRKKRQKTTSEDYHKWYEQNKAHKLAYNRAYYRLHRAARKKYAAEYYRRKKESKANAKQL